jgi:branched-chain amino acid transport system permease protein
MSQLLAVSFSQVFGVQFWINVGLLAAIYGLFTAGMQLNIGTTGLYNFAQAGFMAVGAYTMGILVVDAHLSFWAALPLAAASAVAVALIVGVPSLRLRGDYFAIATIAASETIQYIIQNIGITGGNQGLLGFNGQWTTLSTSISSLLDLSSSDFLVPLLIVSWVIFILALVALSVLQRTPWGRVLKAIRDDQDAARSLGKSIFRYKLQSLSIAAGVAPPPRPRGPRRLPAGARSGLPQPQRVHHRQHLHRGRHAAGGRARQLPRRAHRRGAHRDAAQRHPQSEPGGAAAV